MDRSEELTLVTETMIQDNYGVWRKTTSERTVFCQADSVTRSEFFEAGRNGLNPEYRFTLFYADYNGERTVRYKDKYYGIYRTYHARTDIIELYAERKGGTNASTSTATTGGIINAGSTEGS